MTPDAIIAAVCECSSTTPSELAGSCRCRRCAYARHVAMYLLKHDAGMYVADIGRMFDDRDHSTVIRAIRRIELELRTRPETAADVAAVREMVAMEARHV